jgi:hypothetical protein
MFNYRAKRLIWLSLSTVFIIIFSLLAPAATYADPFADPAFTQLWSKTDQAVANGKLSATWIWGPEPRASTNEAYTESPGGKRLVQYFDKSRMEINDPSADRNSDWFVSNGLLCRELVSGQLQTGNASSETRTPANVPVGGDLDSPVGPTYATFNSIASLNNDHRVTVKSGFVTNTISRDGQIGTTDTYSQRVRYSYFDDTLGHNIPDVFINWMNGLSSRGVSWKFAIGLPLTEPYWAKFKIAGVERVVLVQLFERRALTFNPLNDPVWQVEMGNIGLHYMAWRYNGASIPAVVSTGLDIEETAFLGLINKYRKDNGKGELKINTNLTTASKWLSQDMATKGYFDHTDSQGRDFFTRLKAFGYSTAPAGENIAAGYMLASETFLQWKNSPGHNANMLSGDYTVIGIGRAYNASSKFKWYWTTDFGAK